MTTASSINDHSDTQTRIKSNTHRIFLGVMRYAILPVALSFVAQMGLFVRQDIWALSLWWFLPLFTLVAVVVSLLRDLFKTAQASLTGFDWGRFAVHPMKTIKTYRNSSASNGRWQNYRQVARTKIRNRAFFWVVPLVVFVSFLVLILGFGGTAMALWTFVAGNQNFGQNGFGFFSFAITLGVSLIAVNVYWKLMRLSYAPRFARHRLLQIIIFTALVPLAFVLVIGCSITINSGF